jgi:hypothetical protein
MTSLTPEGVIPFFGADPIHHFVVLFLFPHIFRDGRFIQPHGADILPPCPEVSIAILVFQVRMVVEDHQGTFPFQVPHETRHTHQRWNGHQQMHVVHHRFPFDDLHALPLAQVLQYLDDTRWG